jgi:Uma2 family endonuclease
MSTAILEAKPVLQEVVKEPTPALLLKMEDGHRFELLGGKLVERNMGAESSKVSLTTMRLVGNHAHAHKQGEVFGADCGYQIFPDEPKRVRFPDGSFIATGRLAEGKTPRGHMRIVPDLAIEAVSPNDKAEEVEAKRIEFLKVGTKLLWVIYPESRTVHVFRQSGQHSILTEADELSGEDVLPGFTCRVAQLFE